MPRYRVSRRASWLEALPQGQLHGLMFRLRRQFELGTITQRQDWLLEEIFIEIDRRWNAETCWWKRCCCEICGTIGPNPPHDETLS